MTFPPRTVTVSMVRRDVTFVAVSRHGRREAKEAAGPAPAVGQRRAAPKAPRRNATVKGTAAVAFHTTAPFPKLFYSKTPRLLLARLSFTTSCFLAADHSRAKEKSMILFRHQKKKYFKLMTDEEAPHRAFRNHGKSRAGYSGMCLARPCYYSPSFLWREEDFRYQLRQSAQPAR